MKYMEFNKTVGEGVIQNLYLFEGEENFVKERSLARLIAVTLGNTDMQEWNLSVFDDRAEEDSIIAAAKALPMMTQWRLVVVKDCSALLSRGADMPHLLALLEHIPSTTVLIFYMRQKMDKKRKMAKALKDCGVSFPILTEREIAQYLRADAKQHGFYYDHGVLEKFLFYGGNDMRSLVLEAQKLYLFIAPNGAITVEMVNAIVTRGTVSNVFGMMDAAIDGNVGESFRRLDLLFSEGESSLAILGAMGYRIRMLLTGKAVIAETLSIQDAMQRMQGPRFVVEKTLREGKRFSEKQLIRALSAVNTADYLIKSGKMNDQQAVHNALLQGFG